MTVLRIGNGATGNCLIGELSNWGIDELFNRLIEGLEFKVICSEFKVRCSRGEVTVLRIGNGATGNCLIGELSNWGIDELFNRLIEGSGFDASTRSAQEFGVWSSFGVN
jgi:hypothetical protein